MWLGAARRCLTSDLTSLATVLPRLPNIAGIRASGSSTPRAAFLMFSDKVRTMFGRILLPLMVVGCAQTYPHLSLSRKGSVMGVGATVSVDADWSTTCSSSSGGWFPGMDRRESSRRCAESAYDIVVVCTGGCEISPGGGVSPAIDSWKGHHLGELTVVVRPTGRKFELVAKISRWDESRVTRLGPVDVVYAADFEILCGTSSDHLGPCDRGPLDPDATISVTNKAGIDILIQSMNGKPTGSGVRLLVSKLLPTDREGHPAAGRHPIDIVINPPPHTVWKRIWVELAPNGDEIR